jgi:DNA-binding response OmpR family regulator
VVEDEEDVGRMMEAALTAAGYRVLRARSGIVALEAVRDHRNEIRLTLLDLVLPGLGGTEVYRLLRTLAPEVPVAFATARPDLAEAVAPNTSCLRKPFTEQELLDAVSEAIAIARESPQGRLERSRDSSVCSGPAPAARPV